MLRREPQPPRRSARPRPVATGIALSVLITVFVVGLTRPPSATPELGAPGLPEPAWPTRGQAAIWVPGGELRSTRRADAVPIASVAKIMTALVVLEHFPLRRGDPGFSIMITSTDVEDTELARARGESLVDVRDGESLTERQALLALMLPSANNVARILAVRTAGSEADFVDLMNARARDLGLTDTRYADASGFSTRTVSTARDQTRLAAVALRNPTFAWLVRQSEATIPVAGRIATTDRLLGQGGFVGVKTGSHRAAGGCFVFAVHRTVGGEDRLIVGAVLGQRGPSLTDAAFAATETLVDSVAAG